MDERPRGGRSINTYLSRHGEALGILIVMLLTAIIAFSWAVGTRLNRSLSEIWSSSLEERSGRVGKILYQMDSYFMPDKAYFAKLKWLFFYNENIPPNLFGNSVEYQNALTAVDNILLNIQKGCQYSSNLRSTYLMLEDQAAPYVIVNGKVKPKSELSDTGWEQVCLDRCGDFYLEWRQISFSYSRKADVISIYQKVTSTLWKTGEQVTGYLVMNYDRSGIVNKIGAQLREGETVCLYNVSEGEALFIGGGPESESAADGLVEKHLRGGVWQGDTQGKWSVGGRVPLYYRVERKNSSFLYIVLKEEPDIGSSVSSGYVLFVAILLVCCVIILLFGVINFRQYRNYGEGLRKVLMLSKPGGKDELSTLNPPDQKTETDYNQIVDRLLNNTMDAMELETALQSQKELRMELEILYGHVQINSHFLLNTLDSIYWFSVQHNGVESEESVMIEDLCMILKYALDSSDLYTSLQEEANCAKMYLAIQQIRKKIAMNVIWDIPERLLRAKVGKLTMQPILENCIQHGMTAGAKSISILVEARERDGVLSVSVSDSGTGMSELEMQRLNRRFRSNRRVRTRHIGLSNVNRRIQVQYGPEYGVSLSRAEKRGGLCVTMRLAFIPYEKEK